MTKYMAVLVKLAIHLVFVKQASKLKDSPIHTKWMEEPPPHYNQYIFWQRDLPLSEYTDQQLKLLTEKSLPACPFDRSWSNNWLLSSRDVRHWLKFYRLSRDHLNFNECMASFRWVNSQKCVITSVMCFIFIICL